MFHTFAYAIRQTLQDVSYWLYNSEHISPAIVGIKIPEETTWQNKKHPQFQNLYAKLSSLYFIPFIGPVSSTKKYENESSKLANCQLGLVFR